MLKTACIAEATGCSAVALRHYFRGRVANPCRYVPIALAMLGLLRAAGAVSEAERAALMQRLKDLALDALVASFPLPKSSKIDTPDLQTAEPRHLLVRDVVCNATD